MVLRFQHSKYATLEVKLQKKTELSSPSASNYTTEASSTGKGVILKVCSLNIVNVGY